MGTLTRTQRLRRHWDRHAAGYDKQITWSERRFFPTTRAWICGQATGSALEVAIGTGLNLTHYPPDVALTGVDLSPAMLAIARRRADELGRRVDLRTGDAQAMPFPDGSFDTVVCTFSLCAIPDVQRGIGEMVRVLRPGGLLLLADHVRSSVWWALGVQWALDLATVPLAGEHYRRRPIRTVHAYGLTMERHERFALGIIEQLAARKP
jgi:ubiquinone/menaquinone biosynthesis C-methylase UbiE